MSWPRCPPTGDPGRDAEPMTTTPPAAPVPRTGRVIHLSDLLKRPVTDSSWAVPGRVSDVVVRLRGAQHPAVKGLAATVGGREVFIPIEQNRPRSTARLLKLTSAKPSTCRQVQNAVTARCCCGPTSSATGSLMWKQPT